MSEEYFKNKARDLEEKINMTREALIMLGVEKEVSMMVRYMNEKMRTNRNIKRKLEDLGQRANYLLRFIYDAGLLEDGSFTFPDGETWGVLELNKDNLKEKSPLSDKASVSSGLGEGVDCEGSEG